MGTADPLIPAEPAPPKRGRVRLGLSGRLTLALAALAALTALAAGTAIWGMERFRAGFDDFALLRYRQMTNVTRLVQSTERLAAAAPRLLTIRDRYNLQREKQYIADLLSLNNRAFEQIGGRAIDRRIIDDLTGLRSALVDNLATLTGLVERRLATSEKLDARLRELGEAYVQVNRGEAARPHSPALGAADRALPIVLQSLGYTFPAEIEAARRQVAELLAAAEAARADARETGPWQAIRASLDGDEGFFALRLRQLDLNPKIQGLLLENNALSGRLSSSATNLFVDLDARNTRDRDGFERMMAWGRGMLVSVTLAAVLGALVVFLTMRGRVVARLVGLQRSMADNAAGIATPIPTDGNDEIADMAHSLEIFVRSMKEQKSELHRLASTDALTNLRNRRSFFSEAEGEFDRFRRYGEPTAVLMLDLDHFKEVNDTFGHAAGDQALRHVANLLRQALRSTDTAGRIGGEEFAVLLPSTAIDAARQIAERIRKTLSERPVLLGDHQVSCTISVGATQFAASDETFDGALLRADKALYQAKLDGRDRVAVSA